MTFVFTKRKSNLFQLPYKVVLMLAQPPFICSNCDALRYGTSQRRVPAASKGSSCYGGDRSSGYKMSQARGLIKVLQFQRTLAPMAGTLSGELACGRIVNIMAHSTISIYFTCHALALYWAVSSPQKSPFAQLSSRAHQVEKHLLIPVLLTRAILCEQEKVALKSPI